MSDARIPCGCQASGGADRGKIGNEPARTSVAGRVPYFFEVTTSVKNRTVAADRKGSNIGRLDELPAEIRLRIPCVIGYAGGSINPGNIRKLAQSGTADMWVNEPPKYTSGCRAAASREHPDRQVPDPMPWLRR